ncbi:hypothetical protein Nmel_011414 [Mimus melanotis]
MIYFIPSQPHKGGFLKLVL